LHKAAKKHRLHNAANLKKLFAQISKSYLKMGHSPILFL